MGVDLNAAELRGMISRNDPWRKAVLVACSVERGQPGPKKISANTENPKVSAEEFARMVDSSGFSGDTALRLLDKWTAASEAEPENYPALTYHGNINMDTRQDVAA